MNHPKHKVNLVESYNFTLAVAEGLRDTLVGPTGSWYGHHSGMISYWRGACLLARIEVKPDRIELYNRFGRIRRELRSPDLAVDYNDPEMVDKIQAFLNGI